MSIFHVEVPTILEILDSNFTTEYIHYTRHLAPWAICLGRWTWAQHFVRNDHKKKDAFDHQLKSDVIWRSRLFEVQAVDKKESGGHGRQELALLMDLWVECLKNGYPRHDSVAKSHVVLSLFFSSIVVELYTRNKFSKWSVFEIAWNSLIQDCLTGNRLLTDPACWFVHRHTLSG